MAKNVTLTDIAAKVGVSTVTVSKALAGKPGVGEELRLKIRQVADRMGYLYGAPGKPAAAETGNIGVIVPENYYGYALSFYGQLYEKVVKALYKNRYYGILELLTKEDERERNIPKVLLDGKVDGLIFMGQIDEGYIRKMVEQADLPVFFLDTYRSSVVLDTVISDGYYGTYLLTDYLIRKGHKKIAFIGNIEATNSIADRYWGYRKALRENHIEFESDWEIPDRTRYGNIGDRILYGTTEMEAYVCNCDDAAQVVIQNLEEMGYSVPEDVSVVGFDDFQPDGRDRITSYWVDMDRMAETCVNSLIRKIRHEKYDEGVQIITGKIIEKKTVKDRK